MSPRFYRNLYMVIGTIFFLTAFTVSTCRPGATLFSGFAVITALCAVGYPLYWISKPFDWEEQRITRWFWLATALLLIAHFIWIFIF